MSRTGPLLFRRIVHGGLSCAFTGAESRLATLFSAQIIVDERELMGGKVPSTVYPPESLPFHRFWVEGRFMEGEYRWGALYVDDIPGKLPTLFVVAAHPKAKPVVMLVVHPGADGKLTPDGAFIPATVPAKAQTFWRVTGGSALLSFHECMQMLECRNIGLRDDDLDRNTVKRLHQKTPHPSCRYHTLVVKPFGKRSQASDAEEHVLGSMPEHMCRGHFSEYGPKYGKGLLFGKYEGRFFTPPHIRGDKKNGVVLKDYALVGAE